MATMDNYERQRFDAIADGLSSATTAITNFQQVLNLHAQREEEDRKGYAEDRVELTRTLTVLHSRLDTLSEQIKENNTRLGTVAGHITNCRLNAMSNKKLAGMIAVGSGVVSTFVSAAAWAVQHYKG